MIRTRVILRDSPPSRNAPTSTGPAFLAALTFKGGTDLLGATAVETIRSMDEFTSKLGGRQTYSVDYDWAELYFREGGERINVARVLGPAAAVATRNLVGTSGTTLVVNAKSAGDWANGAADGLDVEVANGPSGASTRTIIIRLADVEVERSPEFTDRNEAVTWGQTATYVNVALGGGTASLPIVAAVSNLAGGTDDRASITQTHVDLALAQLAPDLGPGQVASPNWQTSTAHLSLLAHAKANNRYALCDSADTTSKSTLLTAAALLQGNVNGLYGSFLSPWLRIGGYGGSTTSRSVPLSAFVAAKAAATDVLAGPNQAPAGEYGLQRSGLVQSVKATYSDTDQRDLQDAGVNLAVARYGQVMFDGNRSLVEPLGADAEWLQMSTCRYRMSVAARAAVIGQGYEHKTITRKRIVEFDNALTGQMMLDEQADWLLLDEDETPGSGYIVNTDDPINTPTTIAAKELNAAIGVRPAPGADFVNIYLTLVQPNQPVA